MDRRSFLGSAGASAVVVLSGLRKASGEPESSTAGWRTFELTTRLEISGAWEMNYVAYNQGHDLSLPGATKGSLPFLMYPEAETAGVRKDCLEPASFKYEITAREITS